MHRRILLVVLAIVLLAAVAGTLRLYGSWRAAQLAAEEAGVAGPSFLETLGGASPGERTSSLAFTVQVPAATPPGEPVVLHHGLQMLVLNKTGERTYSGTIDVSNRSRYDTIYYGYSRGGRIEWGEYGLRGVAKEEFPRKFVLGAANEVNDVVERWKWLPNEPLSEAEIPSLAGTKAVAPRPTFWKGAYLPDFWAGEGSWRLNYEQTIARLRGSGFDWIALKPPTSQSSDDPPAYSTGPGGGLCPDYPEWALREHIRVFKEAGFKVLVSAQLCNTGSFEGRSDAWWKQWYDEMERVMRYYAGIVKEEKADALAIAFQGKLPKEAGAPAFASAEWADILDAAESAGVPITFDSGAWGTDRPEPDILPHPLDLIDFEDRLDFYEVGIHNILFTDNAEHTQAEIDAAVEALMDRLDRLHNETGKPVVLGAVAYQSRTNAGTPWPEILYVYQEPDEIWEKHNVTYSGRQQAMIYESVMRQVAEKPYIQGVFTWGYGYVDTPLSPDEGIRGKMAERVLARWFGAIAGALEPGS